MKIIAFLFTFLICQLSTLAQVNQASVYGLDTSFLNYDACNQEPIREYFNYHAKYPESSMNLLKRVQESITSHRIELSKNGFITFRFTVNCKGQISRFKLYLLDENYADTTFEKDLVLLLYDFIKGLNGWKIVKDKSAQHIVNYNSYFSFQIKNGKIISVAP
jgi:hypothetical protein